MKNIAFTILTLLFFQSVYTQSISITGQWNYTIPATDITEAGEDFTGIYTSSVNQVYLDVEHNQKWAVSVQKNNIDWDDNIHILIHRTGKGYGIGNIKGGQNYIDIPNNETGFVTGNKEHYSVPLQIQIQNVSVTIPAHNYIAEIVFTLTDD